MPLRLSPARNYLLGSLAIAAALLLSSGQAPRGNDFAAGCEIAETNGQSDALECRDAALERMSNGETKQAFRMVSEWLSRHPPR